MKTPMAQLREYKEEILDLRAMIRLNKHSRICPALEEARKEIEALKERLRELRDFQKNSLTGQDNG